MRELCDDQGLSIENTRNITARSFYSCRKDNTLIPYDEFKPWMDDIYYQQCPLLESNDKEDNFQKDNQKERDSFISQAIEIAFDKEKGGWEIVEDDTFLSFEEFDEITNNYFTKNVLNFMAWVDNL